MNSPESPEVIIKGPGNTSGRIKDVVPALPESNCGSTTVVEVRSGHYNIGKDTILDDVNFTVRRGIIYALLGPSGCGKTTLLNTLVCLRTLSKGQVTVFGTKPGSKLSGVPGPWVGFMPQDLCLYPELSILQTLTYFGKLQLIDQKQLKSRIHFLIKLMDLPEPHRRVTQLSFGQQRRLSLAVTLIHRPPLLLLDEPTVGLDPTLRKRIWGHLLQMVQEDGITIVLTTHYIEEARKAHLVGLMRKGRILVEANPEKLIREHEVESLEGVFLKFCLEEATMESSESKRTEKEYMSSEDTFSTYQRALNRNEFKVGPITALLSKEVRTSGSIELTDLGAGEKQVASGSMKGDEILLPPVRSSWKDHMLRVLTLTIKSTQRLRRNYIFMVMALFLPFVVVLLVKGLLGHELTQLPFAVVNHEGPPYLSAELLDKIDRNTLILKHFVNEEDAALALNDGTVVGAVLIGPAFSETLQKRLQDGIFASNGTIRDSIVHVRMGVMNPVFTSTVYRALMKAFDGMASEMVTFSESGVDHTSSPLLFKTPVFGTPNPTYSEFIMPGWICGILYCIGLATSCLLFSEEFEKGLFYRNRVAGVSTSHLISSQLLMQLVTSSIHVSGMLAFIILGKVGLNGSFVLVALLLFLQSGVGTVQGLLVAVLARKISICFGVLLIIQCLDYLISGMSWPLEGMPHPLRYLSVIFSPVSANSRATQFVLSRGLTLGHNPVWFAVAVNTFWIVISFLGVVAILFRRS